MSLPQLQPSSSVALPPLQNRTTTGRRSRRRGEGGNSSTAAFLPFRSVRPSAGPSSAGSERSCYDSHQRSIRTNERTEAAAANTPRGRGGGNESEKASSSPASLTLPSSFVVVPCSLLGCCPIHLTPQLKSPSSPCRYYG